MAVYTLGCDVLCIIDSIQVKVEVRVIVMDRFVMPRRRRQVSSARRQRGMVGEASTGCRRLSTCVSMTTRPCCYRFATTHSFSTRKSATHIHTDAGIAHNVIKADTAQRMVSCDI